MAKQNANNAEKLAKVSDKVGLGNFILARSLGRLFGKSPSSKWLARGLQVLLTILFQFKQYQC